MTSTERQQQIEKARELIAKGMGDEDVAVAIYGHSDGMTRNAARILRYEIQSQAGGR